MSYMLNNFVISSIIGVSTTASTYLGSMVYEPKDWRYRKTISNTQRYKMLGNGWTVAVISHIMKNMEV